MRKNIIYLMLAVFGIMQAANIDFKLIKPDTLFVGTEFDYEITINSSVNDTIFTPKPDTLGVFLVKKVFDESSAENETKTTKISYKLAGFDVGKQAIEPIEFVLKNGNQKQKLATKQIDVEIKSILPKDLAKQIEEKGLTDSIKVADIAPLKGIKLNAYEISLPIVALTILVLLIIFIIKKLKAKPEVKPEEKIIIDTRQPYEKGLELLEKLKAKPYINNGNFLQFYFELSYILRYFIELEYKFLAVEMTTSEIRKSLKLEANKKSEVLEFLNNCDMIKFAKAETDSSACQNSFNWVYKFIISYKGGQV